MKMKGNTVQTMLAEIDEYLNTLQTARTSIAALLNLDNHTAVGAAHGVAPKKRVMSAAGRRRISLAQKARWAKVRRTRG